MAGLAEWVQNAGYNLSLWVKGGLHTHSWSVIFWVFLAGVVTSFTPCVYPMIPVTVTFIGGAAGGDRKRAVVLSFVYVAGLALVYASLGVAAALLGKVFGEFTRSPWVYGAVGLIIVVFGFGMLDLYSIRVPAMFAGVQSEGARRGGLLGALLMGMAAGFVAAPCTAPVLGALISYVATTGDLVWGGSLLLIFAFGLGLLLLLLGIFSGFLSSLPRAGGWMDKVKKGFGIAMIVVGLVFVVYAVIMAAGRGDAS